MREATIILWNERTLDRETRQTTKADDSLIHPEPGTERLDRSEFCNTRHEEADTGTGWETCHCADSKDLGMRGRLAHFEGKPEGEQDDGVKEGDDWDGVEAAKAVSEVGGEDTADDGTTTGEGVRNIHEKGGRKRDYFRTTIVYIAVSLEKLCRRAIVGRKFQVEKSPQLFWSAINCWIVGSGQNELTQQKRYPNSKY